MLDIVFSGLFDASTGISVGAFLICMGTALVLGIVIALRALLSVLIHFEMKKES